jgi:dolichyl-phosphate-mannose--protein O-mannosyl transferase
MRPLVFNKFQAENFALDLILSILLLIASFVVRFFHIESPSAIVFDEIHFGNFTGQYLAGHSFLDIHPPLGKLVLYFGAIITRYNTTMTFILRGNRNYTDGTYIKLRSVNAAFSSVVPLFQFLSFRAFGLGIFSSFVPSLLLLFENSLIIEGRFILTDGILHGFVSIALFSIALLFRIQNRKCLIFCGICVGCAISTKQTSWGLFVVIGVVLLFIFLPGHTHLSCQLLILIVFWFLAIALFAFSIYFMAFFVHLQILPSDSNKFIFERIIRLMTRMHKLNMGIIRDSPITSRWWQWPLHQAPPISYFLGDNIAIRLHFQLFNCYCAIANLAIFICLLYYFGIVNRTSLGKDILWRGIIFMIGYLASLVPFALIPRNLFLYHYLIPLMFALGLTGFTLEFVQQRQRKLSIVIGVLLVCGSAISFWRYRYWIYGLPLKSQRLGLSHWSLPDGRSLD